MSRSGSKSSALRLTPDRKVFGTRANIEQSSMIYGKRKSTRTFRAGFFTWKKKARKRASSASVTATISS